MLYWKARGYIGSYAGLQIVSILGLVSLYRVLILQRATLTSGFTLRAMGLHICRKHSMDPHSHSEIARGSLIGRGGCTWSIMPSWPQIYTTHLVNDPGLLRWCGISYAVILALEGNLQASSTGLETHEDTCVPPQSFGAPQVITRGQPLVHCFWGSSSSLWHPWTSSGLLEGPKTCIDYYLSSWQAYLFICELVWWACHQSYVICTLFYF